MSRVPGADGGSPRAEAVSALLALGYRSAEITRLLERIDTAGRSAEQIIRDALRASSA